ncbi:MAG: hypothetical protein DYG89_54585 [Caldilinea sp. CFX5]|nr:hypothetical protein [Caldilinea sp. CFX5]
MKMQRITFVVMLIYLWVMLILLGSIVLETWMIYPNIFRDPPASFAVALDFMSVRAPHDFFPPLGFLSWVTGAGSLLLGWRVKSARYWIVGSLLMIVAEGLVSMAFFWPRNTIMFIEGTAVHSAEFLRQTAVEFENLHWLRVAFNAVGSALIFTGFLKFYRHSLTAGADQVREQASPGKVALKSI